VMGGSFPSHGIAERDILVVDAAADRAPDRVAVVMNAGEVYLAVLKKRGPTWAIVRADGQEIEVAGDVEVWGIVRASVRENM